MKRYAVIGNPVEHSLSPRIHQLFAQQTGIQLSYAKILAPRDEFANAVSAFFQAGGHGLNVTVPFKERAFELATHTSQAAIDAQAVNTLVLHEDGVVEGCNTDGVGLIRDLTRNQHYDLCQKRILILGAGGAVRGILAPLLAQAPASITVANRTVAKAQKLAEHVALFATIEARSLEQLDDGPYDLIIHATSVREEGMLQYSNMLIGQHTVCYDLNYAISQHTPFVRWAKLYGAYKAVDGLGMLVEQAAASYYIWHGIYPDTVPVLNALRSTGNRN